MTEYHNFVQEIGCEEPEVKAELKHFKRLREVTLCFFLFFFPLPSFVLFAFRLFSSLTFILFDHVTFFPISCNKLLLSIFSFPLFLLLSVATS